MASGRNIPGEALEASNLVVLAQQRRPLPERNLSLLMRRENPLLEGEGYEGEITAPMEVQPTAP